jgi:hypothetical protein
MVSLFASAVRPKLWKCLVDSLGFTLVNAEIVFAGNAEFDDRLFDGKYCKYIKTGNIKPAQCYEIARRHCTGEVVVWIADDCEFPNDVIGKAYKYWKSQNNEKLILSIQTKESGYNLPEGELFDMNKHRFFGLETSSPLMAPLGMMSRKFLDDLGGIDRRYVAGQYENDIVMRAYQHGATVEIFGGPDCYIDIDHLRKSIEIGESKNQEDFLNRPFARGYLKDREVLENSWTLFDQAKAFKRLQAGERPSTLREVSPIQLDEFEPYQELSLTKSESNKGHWE